MEEKYTRHTYGKEITDTCVVCGKEFKVTDECNYWFNKRRVCSWACFLKGVKQKSDEREKLKKEKEEKKKA